MEIQTGKAQRPTGCVVTEEARKEPASRALSPSCAHHQSPRPFLVLSFPFLSNLLKEQSIFQLMCLCLSSVCPLSPQMKETVLVEATDNLLLAKPSGFFSVLVLLHPHHTRLPLLSLLWYMYSSSRRAEHIQSLEKGKTGKTPVPARYLSTHKQK